MKQKVDIEAMRHSCAHVLAEAVMQMFPEAKLGIGPTIEDGFYYDFELPRTLIPEDLPLLEKKMKQIVKQNQKFIRRDESAEKAKDFLEQTGQKYKLELVDELAGGEEEITFYESVMPADGKPMFVDLCRGHHVEHTGQIGPFKLLKIAGAYWRGDEKNPMLQRIYGTCWHTKEELDEYLNRLEEVKKRDHRKLGKDLELFTFDEEAGAGLVLWLPKGARVRNSIEEWWKAEHFKNGYELLFTPHIGKASLWQTSGHLDFYRDSMYSQMDIDGEDYFIRPMNCPFHIKAYQSCSRSYRDLPMRWAELGTVYRYEKSGVLHGLLRVRGFTQDDAHIFCTPEQIEDEVREVLRFSLYMWEKLGFTEIKAYLATMPEKRVGEPERWEKAQDSLLKAVKAENLEVEIDEGGGAFYGPKIDLKVKDAIGREWQMTTIQFDFNLPERFDVTYVGEDGNKHRPYMVHRALLGSIERFMGILTEHYSGAFPVWLAPVQARILPVSDKFNKHAEDICKQFKDAGVRVEIDDSNETLGKKIRSAELMKIPYMIVIGEKEVAEGTIAVRDYATKQQKTISFDEFFELL